MAQLNGWLGTDWFELWKFIALDVIKLKKSFNFQCVAKHNDYELCEFLEFMTNILVAVIYWLQLITSS